MLWPFRPSLPIVKIVYFWPETTGKSGILPKWMGSVAQGVPQGSILGPLILNIFINNIIHVLENVCNSYNYADDNTLSNTHHSITYLETHLETSAAVPIYWFDVNGMKWNQAKFQAIILNDYHDLSDISICVSDMNIPRKTCVKLLGVL